MYALGGYGAPFYTLGVLLLATAAASLILMPTVTDRSTRTTEKDDRRCSYLEMLGLVFSTADNWLIFAALLVAAMNWTAMDPSMEPYMHAALGIQPAELSLFFLGSFAGYALSSPLWGRLSDYINNTFLLVAACLAVACTISAPAAFIMAVPSAQSCSISSGMPSIRYSFGMPIFLPLISPVSMASKFGTARSIEVLSFGS